MFLAIGLHLAAAVDASSEVRVATFSNTTNVKEAGLELITDPSFAAGFSVIPACVKPDTDPACAAGEKFNLKSPLNLTNEHDRPAWDLAQWGSRTNLQGPPTPYGEGYAWSTETKRLVLYPDGTVEMAVDGAKELDGQYPTDRTSWPSLIASETIAAPGAYGRDVGNVSTMSKLLFNIDFRLLNNDTRIRKGYDPDRDALIAPVNLTVQNLNRSSAGYGDYIWLQVTVYDDRFVAPNGVPDKTMIDLGTKKMIYFVPSSAVTHGSVHAKQWVKFNGDVLPFAKKAIQLAHDKALLKSQKLSDYSIGGVNIGYELTGLNIATFQFRNLSLKAFY